MITIAEPIDADTLRIRHEFLTLPDLQVSVDEVARLFQTPPRHALRMLDTLAQEEFLVRTVDGRYMRKALPKAEA